MKQKLQKKPNGHHRTEKYCNKRKTCWLGSLLRLEKTKDRFSELEDGLIGLT